MEIRRKTKETEIWLKESGRAQVDTGLPMADHLLDQFVKGLGTPLEITVKGDLEIDAHHSLEDLGYVIGRYVRRQYEGNQVARYASLIQVMDDAVIDLAVDLSGRGTLFLGNFNDLTLSYGALGLDDLREFLNAFMREGAMTLHIERRRGDSPHHVIEALFKGLGRLIQMALEPVDGPMSTKGQVEWEVVE